MYYFSQAKTNDDYREMFMLRYNVYCLDKKWLHEGDYPTGEERDHYDTCSTHFVAKNEKNRVVATMRLVHYSDPVLGLPIQKHPNFSNGSPAHMQRSAEMSRFAVDKSLKDYGFKLGLLSKYISLGLVRIMYQHSKQVGIEKLYIGSEPPFIRLMNRWGFCFVPIAEPALYVGSKSTPALLDIKECEEKLKNENSSLFRWLQQDPSELTAIS